MAIDGCWGVGNFVHCTAPRWLDNRGLPLTGWAPAFGKTYTIAGAQMFHGEPCLVLAEMPDALWPAAGFEPTPWALHLDFREMLKPGFVVDGFELTLDGRVH